MLAGDEQVTPPGDIFRVFDSLNIVANMRVAIEAVRSADEATRDRYGEIVFRFFFGLLYRDRIALGDPHPPRPPQHGRQQARRLRFPER